YILRTLIHELGVDAEVFWPNVRPRVLPSWLLGDACTAVLHLRLPAGRLQWPGGLLRTRCPRVSLRKLPLQFPHLLLGLQFRKVPLSQLELKWLVFPLALPMEFQLALEFPLAQVSLLAQR